MEIELSPESQQYIQTQLQMGAYHSASEVIEALVEARRRSAKADGAAAATILSDLAAKQRQRLLEVVKECESIAGTPSIDGFTNRDHDRILYGERS